MSFEFETKVLKLTSKHRKIILDGDKLFSERRKGLDIERFLSLDELSTEQSRSDARSVFDEYRKQLSLEKSFYENFHAKYLTEISILSEQLDIDDRQRFLDKSVPGLAENDRIRMELNNEKGELVECVFGLIDLLSVNQRYINFSPEGVEVSAPEILEQLNALNAGIDTHLERQYELALLQQEREKSGQGLMKALLNMIKNAWN